VEIGHLGCGTLRSNGSLITHVMMIFGSIVEHHFGFSSGHCNVSLSLTFGILGNSSWWNRWVLQEAIVEDYIVEIDN